MNKLISGVLAIGLVTALSGLSLFGCVAEAPDAGGEQAPVALEAQSGPSCDDLDDYCGPTRRCPKGYECSYDNGCGTNYFGTYPNCGATDTCYPTCVEIE